MSDRRPATTIGELDIHLSHVQESLRDLVGAVSNMATKKDIDEITARIDVLEERIEQSTVGSFFDRASSIITKIGAVAAVIAATGGGIAAIVHFIDKVPQ